MTGGMEEGRKKGNHLCVVSVGGEDVGGVVWIGRGSNQGGGGD
jgi:hypothetical protein